MTAGEVPNGVVYQDEQNILVVDSQDTEVKKAIETVAVESYYS